VLSASRTPPLVRMLRSLYLAALKLPLLVSVDYQPPINLHLGRLGSVNKPVALYSEGSRPLNLVNSRSSRHLRCLDNSNSNRHLDLGVVQPLVSSLRLKGLHCLEQASNKLVQTCSELNQQQEVEDSSAMPKEEA
jgi:hypothetical protein